METNKILSADLLDLIFDDRNKDYGAYELRRTYHKRIKNALLITATVGALGFTGTLLATKISPNEPLARLTPGIIIEDVPDEPEPELPKPKPQTPPPVQTKTVIFTPPEIAPDKDVEKPMETQDALNEKVNIGTFEADGLDADGSFQKPEAIDSGTGIIVKPVETGPFEKVEIDARYPGDWGKFLERNLNGSVPSDNGAPPGMYTVMIQFVVDVQGNISDIKALTSHGYGMEQEAIRVLKKTGSVKWIPAFQNHRHVPAYRRQPITFKIDEG
jgi:periplasmic protein TonB